MNMRKEVLKDKEVATSVCYREKLREYILLNAEFIFSKENEADAFCDFIRWQNRKTDRKHLCLPIEPFLVDRNYKGVHTYCVCTVSENGKVTSEYPVIEVSELPDGIWRNGYFLLPDLLTTNLTEEK